MKSPKQYKSQNIEIQNVETDMYVLSYDHMSKKNVINKVNNKWENFCKNNTQIEVITSDEHIYTTKKHKIWTKNYGWKCAEDLLIGDILLTSSGVLTPVLDLKYTDNGDQIYYDLEVEDSRCYYVGDTNPVLVHNCTAYYHIFGYEIETVIQLKNNRANEVSSVKHLDYCIQMSELFYKRFINNQNITLFCNADTPGLYDAFGTPAFDELYEQYEQDKTVRKKVVSMQKLFVDLMEQRSETARIYIMNIDHANTHSPYLDTVYMSNLCVAPETLLLTNKGYSLIGDLEDKEVTIWNGWEWSDTIVRKTGVNQKLINIKFQDDKGNIHNIKCTEYHKFFVQLGNDIIEVRAKDLTIGQNIQNWNPPEFPIDSDMDLYQYHIDWWVYSIDNIERLSDTYCLTEPKRNKMILNGILTGNCVEIIQPSHPIKDINETGIHEYTVAVKNNKLDEFIKMNQNNEFLEMQG